MGTRIAPLILALLLLPMLATATQPTATFEVGILHIDRYGEYGRPIILIPGSECGPWVWQQTIADLEKHHVVYAVTLAGFDGTPPPTRMTGLLDQAEASLLKLIEGRHLDKPVLVGHSLGGALALLFASEHANRIAGAVSVDAALIFPGLEQATVAQREAAAREVRALYAKMTPAEHRQAALADMRQTGVIDPGLAARYAPLVARSDATATGEYIAQGMRTDYRPLLKHAHVPILEISPYYAPDFERAAALDKQPVMTEVQRTAYYQSQLADAPNAKVVSISPSRHFVMLDQPEKFREALTKFLAGLPPS